MQQGSGQTVTEGTLSRAVGNTQASASGASSPVQGSALTVSKIPRDGLGDNTLGAAGSLCAGLQGKTTAVGESTAQHNGIRRSCVREHTVREHPRRVLSLVFRTAQHCEGVEEMNYPYDSCSKNKGILSIQVCSRPNSN